MSSSRLSFSFAARSSSRRSSTTCSPSWKKRRAAGWTTSSSAVSWTARKRTSRRNASARSPAGAFSTVAKRSRMWLCCCVSSVTTSSFSPASSASGMASVKGSSCGSVPSASAGAPANRTPSRFSLGAGTRDRTGPNGGIHAGGARAARSRERPCGPPTASDRISPAATRGGKGHRRRGERLDFAWLPRTLESRQPRGNSGRARGSVSGP